MSPLRSATPNKQFTGFPTQSQSVWNTFQVYLDTSFGPGNFFGQLFNNLQALELSLGVPCLLQEFYLCILFVHINLQVLELSLRVLGILRKAYLYVLLYTLSGSRNLQAFEVSFEELRILLQFYLCLVEISYVLKISLRQLL